MSRDTRSGDVTLARLGAILEAYGGDPLRWPEAERDAALLWLARSAEARALHQQALALDAVLDELPAPAPSPGLQERILAAARGTDAGRERVGGAATPLETAARAGTTSRTAARLRRRRLRALAASLPLAAAAALGLWLLAERPTPSVPSAEPTLEVRIAEIGGYDTPGDALLDVAGVDAYEIDPWVGCPDSVLGCLEVDGPPPEPLSLEEEERFYS